MRTLLPIFTLSLLLLGCRKQSLAPLVVEDATPIVGAGQATTEAFGIETLDGAFMPLIKAGTHVPVSRSEYFSTSSDDQTQILTSLFRGTNQMAASNHALGKFQIVGIQSAPRGMAHVEVWFTITERQIRISAHDLTRDTDLEIQRAIRNTSRPATNERTR